MAADILCVCFMATWLWICRTCNNNKRPKRSSLIGMRVLGSLEQRACLFRRGLGDRKPAVRDCAVALMCHWFNEDAGGSVPSLLRLLDVHNAEEEAEQVVRHFTLVISGHHDLAADRCQHHRKHPRNSG